MLPVLCYGDVCADLLIPYGQAMLARSKVVDPEALWWADGVLLTIRETGEREEGRVVFDAEKWRSGLGAYSFTDCSALRDESGHWPDYRVGAEAIS